MREFNISTRIFFGEGSLERLRSVEKKRVLVVTDGFIYKSGIAEQVAGYLKDCEITYFHEVIPDPPLEIISSGISRLLDANAEVLIAVGGGSSLDAAKTMRILAEQLCPARVHISECFAIPTPAEQARR